MCEISVRRQKWLQIRLEFPKIKKLLQDNRESMLGLGLKLHRSHGEVCMDKQVGETESSLRSCHASRACAVGL